MIASRKLKKHGYKTYLIDQGLDDYYDVCHHYDNDENEMFEEINETDALMTLDKMPEDLLPVCLEYIDHSVSKRIYGVEYLFHKYVSTPDNPCWTYYPGWKTSFIICGFSTSRLNAMLKQLPLDILLKFIKLGTPAKYMSDMCPFYQQTFQTNMDSALLDYCDEGIRKPLLIQWVIEVVALAWGYSSRNGFARYKKQFSFWDEYDFDDFITNPDRLAAFYSYISASRKKFKGILHKLILSILYVHRKFC